MYRVATFLTDREFNGLKDLAAREGSSLSTTCYRILKNHLAAVNVNESAKEPEN